MTKAARQLPNQHLRYERERRGWSQQEVADKVGTTPLSVSRWERGETVPGPHFREKLGEVFGKSPYELGLVAERPPASLSTGPSPVPDTTTALAETHTPLWNVPYGRNSFFTGREEVLDRLRAALSAQVQPIAISQPQAISGLGGIGKTQLAVEYAYRYRNDYQAVLWARAESADLLVSDFLTIAALLDLPERTEQEQRKIVNATLRWFDTHEGWLFILDNADHLGTARAFSTGTIAERIELETMTIEEGMLFLLRRIKRIRGNASLESISETVWHQARAIVEAMDALPLALDQAGAYIEETGTSLSDYLKLYRARRHRLLRMRGQDAAGHPEPVATTWLLSVEKIKQANPAAAALLCLLALLHPDNIADSMIVEGAAALGPVLQPVVSDAFDFNEALGELHKYSLIKRDPEEKILAIHRLVQAVIWDGMDKEIQQEWAERTVRMVNQAFPEVEFAKWPVCQQYLPHAQVCAQLIEQWNMPFVEAAQLLSRMGNYLRERAQYQEAEQLLQKVLMLRKQALGSEHIEMATAMNNLAGLYVEMGRYVQAEELYQRAHSIRERVLGPTHPDVATTIHDLGMLYREQGRLALAESLFEKVLAIRTQVLGSEHPDVAMSLDKLALVYDDQGKYAASERHYQQALAIWEKTLGPDHPDVATCLNNLGWRYYRRGQYDLAEATLLRACTIYEKGLGPNHPDIVYSLDGLALIYLDQGKYVQAEPLFQRALAIREKVLEPEHPEIAITLDHLGNLYLDQSKYTEAESLLQRALRLREQCLGLQHPETAESLHDFARYHEVQNQLEEALALYLQALTIREQQLGPQHPRTVDTRTRAIVLLRECGRTAEATALEATHPRQATTSDKPAR